jgi:hypothetical protein
MLKAAFAAIILSSTWASPAHALCIYHGVDNAKTTLDQELRDSQWVVRAHLVSADYHWEDEGESWTLYTLRVVERFKGDLPREFLFYTERNSGGFYMDSDSATPDFDTDYLLFLVPLPHSSADPSAAQRALWVNYNCGQSKPWNQVSQAELARLREATRRR